MKQVIRRAYFNYEKEERWLNEMAAKGLALVDYSWCRYVFEESEPGEYTYRIELLEHRATQPESRQYIRFMEENGAEHIASYMRWVYFRKKSADGAFDIYSDLDSRIRHYRRVFQLFLAVMILEFWAAALNIGIGIYDRYLGIYHSLFNFSTVAGSITLVLGVLFLVPVIHFGRRIRRLKRERELME